MSDEHAWPQWLGKGAEVEPTQTTRTIGYGRTGADAMTEAPNLVIKKNGSVLTTRIREVCRECNNGWMSGLETSVKPLLNRLWSSGYAYGRTALGIDEAATVGTWATKTAWIRERVSDEVVTATREMRRYLMDHQLPPEFTRVWVARHQGRSDFGVYVGRLEATHQDDGWDTDRRRHILMCVLTFRGLSVLVRTDDGWGVPPLTLPESRWRLMWPVSEPVQWPPAEPVSDAELQLVAMRYDWLRHPDIRNFHRDPNGIQTIARN